MTTYEEIKVQVKDCTLPTIGENENGEMVVVSAGKDDEGMYFKLTTMQENDWCRVEYFYETGIVTETYEK